MAKRWINTFAGGVIGLVIGAWWSPRGDPTRVVELTRRLLPPEF